MFALREPSPEEHRQASELWLSRIGPTLIDQWPAEVLALSMPTKFIRFPMGLLDALFEPGSWPDPGIDALPEPAVRHSCYAARCGLRCGACWPAEAPLMVGRYARARQIAADMERRRNPDGVKLISLNDAASWGVERLRIPMWANTLDHIKIDIFNKRPGPWVHLFSPFNTECNGRDPVDLFITQFGENDLCYVPYTGPLPDSAEYRAEVAKFAGCLSRFETPQAAEEIPGGPPK